MSKWLGDGERGFWELPDTQPFDVEAMRERLTEQAPAERTSAACRYMQNRYDEAMVLMPRCTCGKPAIECDGDHRVEEDLSHEYEWSLKLIDGELVWVRGAIRLDPDENGVWS